MYFGIIENDRFSLILSSCFLTNIPTCCLACWIANLPVSCHSPLAMPTWSCAWKPLQQKSHLAFCATPVKHPLYVTCCMVAVSLPSSQAAKEGVEGLYLPVGLHSSSNDECAIQWGFSSFQCTNRADSASGDDTSKFHMGLGYRLMGVLFTTAKQKVHIVSCFQIAPPVVTSWLVAGEMQQGSASNEVPVLWRTSREQINAELAEIIVRRYPGAGIVQSAHIWHCPGPEVTFSTVI